MASGLRIIEEENAFRENFKRELGGPDGITSRPLLCTICNINIKHRLVNYRNEHCALGVLVCNTCGHRLRQASKNSKTKNLCQWCMSDNTTFNVSCNQCPRKFCRKCITKHLLRKHKTECWTCFVCNPKQLWHLRVLCSEATLYNENYKKELERRKNRSSGGGARLRLNTSAGTTPGARARSSTPRAAEQARSSILNNTDSSVISPPKETVRASASVGKEGSENSNAIAVSSKAERKNEKSKESCCVICMDAESRLACVPCGHLCLCEPCFPEFERIFSRCPICRQVYFNTLKIYSQT